MLREGRVMSVTAKSWVSKRADRQGGEACVRDTRIPAWVIVNYLRLGGTEANLLHDYPSLTAADVEAVREYAAAHAEEIDNAIRANE
jgi:uncharacterized protein (DUF433 family)